MNESFPTVSDAEKQTAKTENTDRSATPPSSADLENWNYEETVTAIEVIISQIETGELPIADVFNQFETAVNHLQRCESFLSSHQQKVDLLIETLNDGDSAY